MPSRFKSFLPLVLASLIFFGLVVKYSWPQTAIIYNIGSFGDSVRNIALSTDTVANRLVLGGGMNVSFFPGYNTSSYSIGDDKTVHYLELPSGVILSPRDSFFVSHRRYYLKYAVWDKTKRDGAFVVEKTGHYAVREIPCRWGEFGNEPTHLFVEMGEPAFQIYRVINWILLLVLVWGLIVVFIRKPFLVLKRISSGNAFVEQNVRDLRTIAFAFIGLALAQPALDWAIFGIFRIAGYIPGEFEYPVFALLAAQWKVILFGLAVWIISMAFERGYNLEQERELVI